MAIELSIVDNADGSGAVATVSGSDPASLNVVKVAPWTAGSLTFSDFGPIIGDGMQALAIANGYHVGYVASTLVGSLSVSNVVTFATSGGSTYDSVEKALAEAVAAKIRSLLGTAIVGPAADSIRVRKIPWTDDFGTIDPHTGLIPDGRSHAWPAILVCYFDQETFDPTAGMNSQDEIGYPISVAFYRPNNTAGQKAAEDGDDTFLRWREAVERTFTHLRGVQSGAGLDGYLDVIAGGQTYTFFDCKTRPGAIFDYSRWKPAAGSFDFGWLLFSFILWRPGGA